MLSAFTAGERVELCAIVPRSLGVTEMCLCIRRDTLAEGEEGLCPDAQKIYFEYISSELDNDEYRLNLDTAALCGESGSGLFYYTYIFVCGKEELVASSIDNVSFTLVREGWREFRLLLCDKDISVPSWLGSGIMYHIFVDRFKRGKGKVRFGDGAVIDEDWDGGVPQYAEYRGAPVKNNVFFGGNLWGVVEELDYLRSLGVSVIYLSPIFKSVSNHKYDTSDYFKVDEGFGGDEAFSVLADEAHKRGMRIILDGVFNHTGDDSIYFDKYERWGVSAENESSKYHGWYEFREPVREGDAPYVCWWGIPILPRLNTHKAECREFFTGRGGVAEHHLLLGADGWRLDVADELPDEFLFELKRRTRQVKSDSVLIGEVWENASDKIAYGKRRRYFRGKQLDSVMNYPTRKALLDYASSGDGEAFAREIRELYSSYPREISASLMNVIGTHDTERVLTLLGDREGALRNAFVPNRQRAEFALTVAARARGLKLLRAVSAMQYTLFGFPCVYYGDEVGCEGLGDPFCRYPMPWKRMDESLLSHYRRLGEIRRAEDAFAGGEFEFVAVDGGFVEYKRQKNADEYVLVAVNMAREAHTVKADGMIDLYCDKMVEGDIELGWGEFAILKVVMREEREA